MSLKEKKILELFLKKKIMTITSIIMGLKLLRNKKKEVVVLVSSLVSKGLLSKKIKRFRNNRGLIKVVSFYILTLEGEKKMKQEISGKPNLGRKFPFISFARKLSLRLRLILL